MNDLITLDDIRNLAKEIYGAYPKGLKMVQKVYLLTYPSANDFSDLLILQNPIYVTNIMVSNTVGNLSDTTFISASANDPNEQKAFNVGQDGTISGGGAIWKYVKASGTVTNGAEVQLTIVGYELDYDGTIIPPQEIKARTVRIDVNSTMATNKYILVDENTTLDRNSLVFVNGDLVNPDNYILNKKGSDLSKGYITFADNVISNEDTVTVFYAFNQEQEPSYAVHEEVVSGENISSITITHTKGYYPIVQILDSNGEMILADVTHSGNSSFTVTFSETVSNVRILYI